MLYPIPGWGEGLGVFMGCGYSGYRSRAGYGIIFSFGLAVFQLLFNGGFGFGLICILGISVYPYGKKNDPGVQDHSLTNRLPPVGHSAASTGFPLLWFFFSWASL